MGHPTIQPIHPDNAADWLRLRCDLWPGHREHHAPEIAQFFVGQIIEPVAVYVAIQSNELIAFIELSLRYDIPNHIGQKVGYAEGLYITPEFRGGDLAMRLLRTAQSWARQQQCIAFASDRSDRIIVDWRYSLHRRPGSSPDKTPQN